MQFITLRPNIVMVDIKGKAHVIRGNETASSINENEKVPEHLTKFEL